MNPLFQAGLELQKFFRAHNWRFCFIGGLAVLRWGEQRLTQDVDVSIFTGFGNEEKFISTILSEFESRIPEPQEFAIKNRVLLIHNDNGVAVDISLSGLSFEDEMIRRASAFAFEKNCSLITCSAEDLVVLKAFASREKDWLDVKGLIIRHKKSLDRNYIIRQLTPLVELKEEPEILSRINHLLT